MPDPETNSVLERLARREITVRQAIRQLTKMGQGADLARETVHTALGGSDLVEAGADGLERYQPSGRLVSDVALELGLTAAQGKEVQGLVARGWSREEAVLMVVMGEEDIIEDGDCEVIAMCDYSTAPAKVFARFWWSAGQGLTCDNDELGARLAAEGIATPPDGERVFPSAGRAFFDALRWAESSYVKITPPRRARRQGGLPVVIDN